MLMNSFLSQKRQTPPSLKHQVHHHPSFNHHLHWITWFTFITVSCVWFSQSEVGFMFDSLCAINPYFQHLLCCSLCFPDRSPEQHKGTPWVHHPWTLFKNWSTWFSNPSSSPPHVSLHRSLLLHLPSLPVLAAPITQSYSQFVSHFCKVFGRNAGDASINDQLYHLKQGKISIDYYALLCFAH